MGLLNVIKVNTDRFDSQSMGFLASPVYQRFDNNLSDWAWVVDVDLETASSNPNASPLEPLRSVIIDDPSREVFSADIGTSVKLSRRREDNRYVVTGLSVYKAGTLSVCLVQLSPCGTTLSGIGLPVLFGNTIRALTYSELGDPLLNGGFGYGELQYGTSGKFDINGVLLNLIV
tara:strand:- start:42942 stop:43463 length:522 start_codon:yes stop_codon:yes gene_type:complete